MPTIEDLGKSVKAKYAGQYDDMEDGELGKLVKAKFPNDYADYHPTPRKDSLKGPEGVTVQDDPNMQKGFWESLGDSVMAPVHTLKGLLSGDVKLTDVPKGMLESVGNTIIKLGAGNVPGAAGDIAGAYIAGKVGGKVAGKVADVAGDAASGIAKAGTAAKDAIVTPSVASSLDRAGNYAIGGGAVGLHPVPVIMGTAAKIGAEAIRKSIAKNAAVVAEVPKIYDDIAISQAGKPFSKLPENAQAAIKQMADRIQNGVQETAATPQPEPVATPARGIRIPVEETPPSQIDAEIQSTSPIVPRETPVEPITKANIRPKVQSIAEQLRDSMAESGSLPTETPEGISGKAYEADARGAKAEVVAKALHENGISYKDASSLMEVSDWKQLFRDLGQKEPGASTGDPSPTIQQTLLKLKKLYDAEKPAATPKPNIRRRK